LRRYIEVLPERQTGWLAALRDRFVGRALALLHEHPEREWSVEELASSVGLSRSSLSQRFTDFIGQPPMQYLTRWRLTIAAQRLRSEEASLARIAADSGYDSEAAFNRAFKRAVRDLEFDISELALVTFFQAKAYGKPLTLIPAVVGAGRFQHHCLVYDSERPRVTVAQLAGKRIGIRALAQTTVTWVRGVLAEDYGVPLDEIKWVTFEEARTMDLTRTARKALEELFGGSVA